MYTMLFTEKYMKSVLGQVINTRNGQCRWDKVVCYTVVHEVFDTDFCWWQPSQKKYDDLSSRT